MKWSTVYSSVDLAEAVSSDATESSMGAVGGNMAAPASGEPAEEDPSTLPASDEGPGATGSDEGSSGGATTTSSRSAGAAASS